MDRFAAMIILLGTLVVRSVNTPTFSREKPLVSKVFILTPSLSLSLYTHTQLHTGTVSYTDHSHALLHGTGRYILHSVLTIQSLLVHGL